MKNLVALVGVLKPSEIRYVKHFYKLTSNAEEKKRSELFNLIVKHKGEITDGKAAKKLYGVAPNSAFSHLKARLKKDILNILLMHDSSSKFSTSYLRATFECRKILNQAFILNVRGAFNEGVKLLNSAAALAKKYELAVEQILVNQALRNLIHRIKDVSVLEEYNRSIRDNLELLEELAKVEEYSYIISVPSLYRTNKTINNPDYRREMIEKLEKSFEKTNSAKIGLWYYMSAVDYHTKLKENDKALALGLKFVKLVKESPSIYSSNNWAGVNMTVAGILINCAEYERSVGYARTAVKFFPKGLMNELAAMETSFFAYFRSGKYTNAQLTIEKAFDHKRLKVNKFFYAKWLYLRANLEFVEGYYSESMRTLNQDTELMKDKSGWLLGYRLLEILIMIEQQDYEWLDFKLDSFRKLLQRQKEENIHRVKLILGIFNALMKNDFDYEEVAIQESKSYKALKKAEGDLYWDPMGFEVIRFDDWFERKVKDYASTT